MARSTSTTIVLLLGLLALESMPAGPWRSPCAVIVTPEQQVWCDTTAPDPAEERIIRDAIVQIRARGSQCARLADKLALVMTFHQLHLFDPHNYPNGAASSPRDADITFVIVSREFVTQYVDAAHASGNIDSRGEPRPETLQLILAHEADHLLGAAHVDVDGYLTPNSLRCSDVGADHAP